MKKLLLLAAPLILLGMKFEESTEIKPAKEELQLKEIVYPMPQCFASTANQIASNNTSEGALYDHCNTCGYGVYLGDEGYEKCTYCGVKKTYASRK